jgi:hypothetical protein
VLRIVLPITLALSPVYIIAVEIVLIEIVVPVKIIVVVNVDVAAVPIAIAPVTTPSAPSGRAERNSRSPRQSRPRHITGISVGIIRVFNRSRPVHHSRIIRGYVNDVWVRLLNLDYLFAGIGPAGDCFSFHYRLGAGF